MEPRLNRIHFTFCDRFAFAFGAQFVLPQFIKTCLQDGSLAHRSLDVCCTVMTKWIHVEMWKVFLATLPSDKIIMGNTVFFFSFFFIAHVRSQTLFTLVLPRLYPGTPDGTSPGPCWGFISRSHVIKSLSKVFEKGDDRNCL